MASAGHVCETPGCGKPSKLQCPTCIKLEINNSYFCSQECFKGYWKHHKDLHKTPQLSASRSSQKDSYNPWPGFVFTGKLRPWPVTAKRDVPDHIRRPDYAKDGQPMSEKQARLSTQIRVLNETDISRMRRTCSLAREVLDLAGKAIRVGVTADEIDRVVHEACIERECYPSPLNYFHFPKSCCTSVNEVICHGIPDLRPFEDGDIVNVDVTVYHDGYHGDLNETYFVGNVDDEGKRIVNVAYECLDQAIRAVKPGVRYRDIGGIIQRHAHANGCSVVRTYCGHGIHELFHTAPSVPHYARNKAIGVMRPGHCFTIEPMINLGTWKDDTWPDDWTAVTQDGRRSAQFEQTLLVTEVGCDVLTKRLEDDGKPLFFSQT
ncbi:methionine aminopeptidase 1-like [Corticium candelabrum]|uniref:methionine aminopeptidase 1-like n=1 Tax=Corticium candelabrum TaxID=121492 RepID=UPI002E26AA73|nr:methionine aminopeptidase 1-like [Corticium candelabrum]